MPLLPAALLATLLAASPPGGAQADSATIVFKPKDANVQTMMWVAFDDARRPIGRGMAPGRTTQASNGAAITYCADQAPAWLELTVEVRKGLRSGHITAYGPCTRVVVDGIKVRTTGVADPRTAPASKPAGS